MRGSRLATSAGLRMPLCGAGGSAGGLTAFITSAAAMSVVAVFAWGRVDLVPLAVVVAGCAVAVCGLAVLFSRRLRLLVGRLFGLPMLAKVEPIYLLVRALQAYRERPGALVQAYGIGLLVIVVSNVVNWMVATAVEPPYRCPTSSSSTPCWPLPR